MGLQNPRRERFCQEVYRLTRVENRKLGPARTEAYRLAGFESADSCVEHNARKLANDPQVKARLAEMDDYAQKLAGLDVGWAMVQLRQDFEALGGFNLDDYLVRPEGKQPYYDLSKVAPAKMALLAELTIESHTEWGEGEDAEARNVRKIKLAGPKKFPERVQILALMARLAGWEAPRKVAPTDPTGTKGASLTLEGLVAASYEPPKPEEKAA